MLLSHVKQCCYVFLLNLLLNQLLQQVATCGNFEVLRPVFFATRYLGGRETIKEKRRVARQNKRLRSRLRTSPCTISQTLFARKIEQNIS